jgi:Tfp pilus assembly protein PilF
MSKSKSSETRATTAARERLEKAFAKRPASERANLVRAGLARRDRILAAGGSYRAALRSADGSDAVERR